MATISPNPFPTDGARKLSPAEYIARKKSLACALPKDNKPSCTGHVVKLFYILLQVCLLSLMLSLTACKAPNEETDIIADLEKQVDEEQARTGADECESLFLENHTDKNIVSVIVNGEGGIAHADAHGEGGGAGCVDLPRKWHPGIMVTIKWQEDDVYLLDKNGKFVIEDGKKKVVEQPWKTKTVEVPKYEGKDEKGQFYIFFYQNDVVKVIRSRGRPHRPDYPLLEDKVNGEQ